MEAIYRFALLLTGDPDTASDAVLETLRAGPGHASQFRSDAHRNAWIAMRVRDLCLKKERAAAKGATKGASTSASTGAHAQGDGAAAAFSLMPEPQRSALALFYLDLVPASDLANLFRMKPEGLSDALAGGRDFLRAHPAGCVSAPPETSVRAARPPA